MGALLLCFSLALSNPHAGSFSRTWITLDNQGIQFRSEFQILSLLEILPNLDTDRDGFVEDSELEAHAEVLGLYLAKSYALLADGSALEAGALELRLMPPTPGSFLPIPEWVEVRWEAPLASLPEAIGVHSTLFVSTSPDHRDLLSLRWPGCLAVHGVLDGGQPRAQFQAGASLLQLAAGAALRAAWLGGAGLLLSLCLLLGWTLGPIRRRHALSLMLGALGAGLVLALLGREAASALAGAQLWPLALPLLAAYCAADRAAFGMQSGHGLEAFGGGVLWGLACGLAWLRESAGWDLQPWPWNGLPLLAPLLVVLSVWSLAKLLHKRMQARVGRLSLALAGLLAMGLFARLALG